LALSLESYFRALIVYADRPGTNHTRIVNIQLSAIVSAT
jgi:hypothetical protein